MLSTTITFKKSFDGSILDTPYIKKNKDHFYEIFLSTADKAIGTITIAKNEIFIEYSSELMLAEYIIIHDIIMQLQKSVDGVVDDSNSFLGYLPDGESVYIAKNWNSWISFLNSSMKNCQTKLPSTPELY